jgi:hypothetical protein
MIPNTEILKCKNRNRTELPKNRNFGSVRFSVKKCPSLLGRARNERGVGNIEYVVEMDGGGGCGQ